MPMSGWSAVQWWMPGAISSMVRAGRSLLQQAALAQGRDEAVDVAAGGLVVDVELARERGHEVVARGAVRELAPQQRAGLVGGHVLRGADVERHDLTLHLAPLERVAPQSQLSHGSPARPRRGRRA